MAEVIKNLSPSVSEQISADGQPLQQGQPIATLSSQQRELAPEPAEVKEVENVEQPDNTEQNVDNTDFTKFLDAKNTINPNVKKESPASKDAEKKAPAEEIVEKQKEKITTTPSEVKSEQEVHPDSRDYTEFDPKLVPQLKKMRNDVFNVAKDALLGQKKLKADLDSRDKELNESKQKISDLEKGIVKVPDSYYEHPLAFMLTPEFATQQQRTNLSQQIADHWAAQYQSVMEGSAEYEHIDMGANGQLLKSKRVADGNAKQTLQALMTGSQRQLMQQQFELQNIAQQHKQNHDNGVSSLLNFEKQAFPIFDKPEGEQYKQELDAIKKGLPQNFHNNPLMGILAKSLVVNQRLALLLQNQAKQQQQAPANGGGNGKPVVKANNDRQKAGPTSKDLEGSGSSGSDENSVTMDDFERVKM